MRFYGSCSQVDFILLRPLLVLHWLHRSSSNIFDRITISRILLQLGSLVNGTYIVNKIVLYKSIVIINVYYSKCHGAFVSLVSLEATKEGDNSRAKVSTFVSSKISAIFWYLLDATTIYEVDTTINTRLPNCIMHKLMFPIVLSDIYTQNLKSISIKRPPNIVG